MKELERLGRRRLDFISFTTTSDHELWLDVYHNYHYVNSAYGKTPNGYTSIGNTCILMLSRGDEVYVMTKREGRTYGDIATNQTYTTFSSSTLNPYTNIDDIDDFGLRV
ncbi:uncharacterized protein LOC143085262 isoform X1 [Mytilus galloprovincialis]|uniref:uncharacterized protein LOC143085262 isoform X1 n=1 Tax=Mytilus galloprovincialis TaxID=29158 RepID=UPI003F7C92E9